MSRPKTRSIWCKDCLEERVPQPNERVGNTSYCSHHAYVRTLVRNTRVRLEEHIDRLGVGATDNATQHELHRIEALRQAGKLRHFERAIEKVIDDLEIEALEVLGYMGGQRFRTREEQTSYLARALDYSHQAFVLKKGRRMTEHEISSQLNYFRSLYPARRDVERGAAAKVVERFREEPKAEEDRAEEYRTEEYRAEEYISQPGQCPHDPPCEVGIGCYFIPSEEAKQEAIGRDLDAAWGPAE